MDMAVRRWQTFLSLKSSSTVPKARHGGWQRCLSTRAEAGEWQGLQTWRLSPVEERRFWGSKNASKEPPNSVTSFPLEVEYLNSVSRTRNTPSCLAEWGALVLNTPDPLLKASLTHHAFRLWSNQQLPLGIANAPDRPARPEKPPLVPLKEVPDVKNSPLPRNAHVLHILAHIELNAVDLAWDTVVRFSGDSQVLGHQFFSDFVHVADDESRHFGWCVQRLSELGCQYGDMPAHDMLVSDCQKSSTNVMARLAVVPMVQEARGLDAGPRLAGRLVGWGDGRSAGIVNQIAEEEVAHVAVGVSWFLAVCKMINKEPDKTFKDLIRELDVELKGPFNHAAREKAGLPRSWYQLDNGLSKVKEPGLHSCISSGYVQVTDVEKEVDKMGVNGHGSLKQSSSSSLAEVYKRLELLIAMEKERAAA